MTDIVKKMWNIWKELMSIDKKKIDSNSAFLFIRQINSLPKSDLDEADHQMTSDLMRSLSFCYQVAGMTDYAVFNAIRSINYNSKNIDAYCQLKISSFILIDELNKGNSYQKEKAKMFVSILCSAMEALVPIVEAMGDDSLLKEVKEYQASTYADIQKKGFILEETNLFSNWKEIPFEDISCFHYAM
jgi:hypothetical protein